MRGAAGQNRSNRTARARGGRAASRAVSRVARFINVEREGEGEGERERALSTLYQSSSYFRIIYLDIRLVESSVELIRASVALICA